MASSPNLLLSLLLLLLGVPMISSFNSFYRRPHHYRQNENKILVIDAIDRSSQQYHRHTTASPTALSLSHQPNNNDDDDTTNNRELLDAIHQFESVTEETFGKQRVVIDDILESLDAIRLNSDADEKNESNADSGDTKQDISDTTPGDEAEADHDDDFDRMMMSGPEQINCDVVIVGGGPAGCTCALYTARAGFSTVILDKNPAVGALAITSHIANFPGVDELISGEDLLEGVREQAIHDGADYRRAQVFMIDGMSTENTKADDDETELQAEYMVYTPDAIFTTKTLVLATGAMGRVSPPFPGEDTYLGMGVSYCATCDGAFYRDADVAVKGISLEAMEEATFLTKFAKTVHWVTPSRPRPENSHHVQELLAHDNVRKWPTTKFLSVEGDSVNGVTGIKVKQKDQDEPEIIPVEGAFIYAGGGGGSKPITDFVGSNTIDYKDNGGVIVDEGMATNVQGVFAIGDIRNTANKQVVVAASDGCIAAMSIDKYLNKRKHIKVDWIHK